MKPLKFEDLDELKEAIDKYFADCERKDDPLTITGLALALGTSRQTLINYEKREEYFDTIKEAKTRVENYAEKRLYTSSATGPIFALKNFGWVDEKNHNLGGQKDNPIKSEHKLDASAAYSLMLDEDGA